MKAVCTIIGIVAFVIVGAVAITMVEQAVDDVDPEWSYDDYRVVENAVSVSGVLEMVETHLGSTIHAKDVGEGTIQYADGSTESVSVHRAKLDVYLITGQSNAAYRAVDPSAAKPLPHLGTAYAWMLEDGLYGQFNTDEAPEMRPMVNLDGTAATGDKAPSFAATVNSITGHKTYWICGAWTNMSIINYNPTNNASKWVYMKDVVNEAMDAVDRSKFDVKTCSWMWIQGEKDSDMSVEEYYDRFVTLNDAILSGELGYKFNHCFISLIQSKWGNPVQAQLQLAHDVPTISIGSDAALDFTVANGLMDADDIHYSQLGDNIIGEDLGSACGHLRSSGMPNTDMLGVLPVVVGIVVGIIAIMAAARLVMGRD